MGVDKEHFQTMYKRNLKNAPLHNADSEEIELVMAANSFSSYSKNKHLIFVYF
jgi:hypothetical protein